MYVCIYKCNIYIQHEIKICMQHENNVTFSFGY